MKFLNDLNINENSLKNGRFEEVSSLPSTNLFVGRQVVYNNKIYIYTDSGWISTSQIKYKTTAEWETENPILLKGEMGYDNTNKRYKIGDGVKTWNNLEYTTINGKSKLTLFKSSTKTNQYDGTADLTIAPSDVVGAMDDGNADITDDTEFITSHVNSFNYSGSVNVPYRRKATYIWNWIKSKIDKMSIQRNKMEYGTYWSTDLSQNPYDIAYNKFINQSFLKNMPLNAVDFYISFDNGVTWRDFFEVRTDVTKEKLVGYIFNLSNNGNNFSLDSAFNSNENKWLRVDIQVGGMAYFAMSQFMCYVSRNGVSNPTIHLSGHRNNNYTGTKPTEEWTEFFSNKFAGWGGWNSYGLKTSIYFGNTSYSYFDKLRIELRGDVSKDESDNHRYGPGLYRFMLFGPVIHTTFNNNKSDIKLSYSGDMTFPAKITTSGVVIPNGTATQVLLANGTTNTLKTVGGNALLGNGDIAFKTINNQALIGSGNISIEKDAHDVVLNDIDNDGLEWYLVPVCDDNVGIDNSNNTYLYAKNSTQEFANRFLYNRELNAISCNIYASECDNSIIDVTNNNKSIDFRSIVNILYRENVAYIYSLDDFQNWLITLNGSNTAPTKSITTLISEEIAKVVANAPASFDTLKEIADWISTHQNDASAMNTAINTNTTNITNLTTTVNTNTTNISANANQIHGIKGDIVNINSIINTLSNEINSLKTELQNAKAEIAYLKSVAPVVTAEDGFYVVDADDYIGFKVDDNGATDSATTSIETTNI